MNKRNAENEPISDDNLDTVRAFCEEWLRLKNPETPGEETKRRVEKEMSFELNVDRWRRHMETMKNFDKILEKHPELPWKSWRDFDWFS